MDLTNCEMGYCIPFLDVNTIHDKTHSSINASSIQNNGIPCAYKDFFIRYKLPDQQDQQYKLYAAADSDLAGDPITRRSQTGWFVFYNDGPIAWKSCKQDVVSLSTAEAELRSFVACTKTVIYLKRVLAHMGIAQDKIWIFEDNRACIHITENNMSPGNQRTKHVDILTKIQTTEDFLRSKKQASAPSDILPPLVSE